MQKRIGLAATVVAAAALVLPAVASAAKPAGPEHVRAAFFTNWSRYARGYTVKQIPADKLNVIDYAFAFPSAAGTCILSDAWSAFQAPTWRGTDSRDGASPGVPPPARPGGPLRRQALHTHERHPRWKRELRRELAAP